MIHGAHADGAAARRSAIRPLPPPEIASANLRNPPRQISGCLAFGTSMISVINDAIERSHRLTGTGGRRGLGSGKGF
jgi:hypothetical protein